MPARALVWLRRSCQRPLVLLGAGGRAADGGELPGQVHLLPEGVKAATACARPFSPGCIFTPLCSAARHEEALELRERRLRRHRPLREPPRYRLPSGFAFFSRWQRDGLLAGEQPDQPHALRAAAPRPGAAALEVHRLPRGVRLGRLLYERDGALKEYLSQQHSVRLRRELGQAGGVSCAENGETLVALRVFNLQLPPTASTS